MVITRSQGDAAELEEQKRREKQRTQQRRLSLELAASPSLVSTATNESAASKRTIVTAVAGTSSQHANDNNEPRARSPPRSVYSQRSTNSIEARLRLAELAAAEKLAEIKKKELELEADLIKKRLAAEISVLNEEKSFQDEKLSQAEVDEKVDSWLHTSPLVSRKHEHSAEQRTGQRYEQFKSEKDGRSKGDIERLAETLEKMTRPHVRHTELPTFSGSPSDWLPFKASMRDSTKMYHITAAENIQRLRSCLKGEAREVVAALLHTATNPDVIMRTLEQCFGRPEVILDQAFEELRKLPRLGSSAIELNSFAVKLQNVTCVLETIDRRAYLCNPILAREVLGKLSPHLRSRWCDYASENENTTDPEIIVLSRFLIREADRALKYTYAPSTSAVSPAATKETKPVKKKTGNIYAVAEVSEERSNQCPSCEQTHVLSQCPNYKAMTIDKRWDFVRGKKLCFKCIQRKHRRIYCKEKLCGVNQCRRPHHPTLHQDQTYCEQLNLSEPAAQTTQSRTEVVLSMATPAATTPRAVLLKMCPVVVIGPRGEVNTYALLDEGATISLIDEQLAQSIGAEGPKQPLHLNGVNMSQLERDSKLVTVQLRGKKEKTSYKLRARTIKDLKLHQQSISATLLKHNHLKDLQQEVVCYEFARPGILVGTDHWEYIVSRELRVGEPDQPAASRTELGWVVHGTVPRSTIYNHESTLHIYEHNQHINTSRQLDQQLHELVEAHFRIDALGVTCRPRVNETDQRAISIVTQTIKKIDSGYEVGLPWRKDDVNFPSSYETAYRRLRKIEQKMDNDPEYANQYAAQIENLVKKGYAVPCDGSERKSAICWYLPHFTVRNPNKPGKQRLVFDAAAKSNGASLNDQLLEGPDLLLSLQDILFRFREKPIAITADIQEMFLRVKIRPEDQPAQQFLWRGDDRVEPPRHYKMTSMIFGAKSSPFLAHYVRDHNAKIHAQTYPHAFRAITQNHYMDDFVASYNDEEEARRTIKEVRTVHAAAGFTLREWNANSKSVLYDVPKELQTTKFARLSRGPENKILGLYWNAEQDELGFNTSMNRVPAAVRTQTRMPTKREALSAVMSIYDPLGLLSHFTIRAKIILQSLWRLKIHWDEPIPEEEGELFTDWLKCLVDIADLRLGRCYTHKDYASVELHVLCDASQQAYATVAYWRIIHCDGSISVALVAAKARVTPRRTQTIPRLELQAAVIGARLAETIKKEHSIEVVRTIYWTDSTTVVHWIHDDTRQYTPFVAHRIGEIAELTSKNQWRWLPTNDNVADDATRFARTPINQNDRWFLGPSLLYKSEEQWPSQQMFAAEEEEVLFHTKEEDSQRDGWLPDPARFSKYETLVRATARVLAFIDICRRRSTRMEHRHIECAERELIRRAQEDNFSPELHRIETSRSITKASRLFKLDPVLEEGILRVRGRIGAAAALNEANRPIILDGRHPLTKLIVLREHCAAGHANRERVTNDLRQRYWIIRLRPTVRAVERSCALCKVQRAKPRIPVTGDLPRARLDAFHRPFTNCGVDYFGPMMVKVGRRREKRWGALFTCLTSRAVHIEVVASLSTDSAIMALRRMAARRGWPRLMYSDNATNFRGADRELRTAYAEWAPLLRDEGLLHRMEWRYIPPGAPNQGGAWERLIRSIKTALSVTLREQAPPEEVLRTLLAEAEFSVNARPLTHVSVDPNDPEALTPNHFLLGSSLGLPTTGPCDEADRRTWRASQALADHFWRRWIKEYLPTLVPRGESTKKERPLQVSDIVIVADHALPRNIWPMGFIERTYQGPDGGIRVVDVRTKSGIFKRPVSKLVVILKEEAAQATPGGEMLRTTSLPSAERIISS